MNLSRLWTTRVLACCLGVVALTSGSGCVCLGTYWHPIGFPPPEQSAPCLATPQCCRDRVHVFFLNGLDPLNKDNFPGLKHYVEHLGFKNTYYSQLYGYWCVRNEIRRIHACDPEARFALIGFSFGCNQACHMTES